MSYIINTSEIESLICKRLNVSIDQYRNLVYTSGEEYVDRKCGDWTKIADEILSNRIFWNWWRIQFATIDDRIINRGIVDKEVWYECHSAFDFDIPTAIIGHARIKSSINAKKLTV